MATTADCLAQYKRCMGINPSPLRQTQCTFAYMQCTLHIMQANIQQQLKLAAKTPPGKQVKAKKK